MLWIREMDQSRGVEEIRDTTYCIYRPCPSSDRPSQVKRQLLSSLYFAKSHPVKMSGFLAQCRLVPMLAQFLDT